MKPVSVPPASWTIGMPYVFSNSRCLSTESGAVLDVMKRSAGRSALVTATGLASSMLMTVGMPTDNGDAVVAEPVEEARLRELAREDERGAGQHCSGPTERICGEDQLKCR